MSKASTLDILKQGMSTEIWGQAFYKEAVSRTEAEDGKKIFSSLVDEEGKHLEILMGQYAAVSGDKTMVSVDEALVLAASVDATTIFPKAQAAEGLIPADASDEKALELAMDFERRGYKLYADQAATTDSLEARAVWEWLAKAEDAHYKYLADTLDYLKSNGVWYFDEQELPFFEG